MIFWRVQSLEVIVGVTSIVAGISAAEESTPQSSTHNASYLVSSQTLEAPFPYYFPNVEDPTALFPMLPCDGFTLEEATIDQLQDAMSNGRLTSSRLLLCYLQRIYQTDDYIKYVISATFLCFYVSCRQVRFLQEKN